MSTETALWKIIENLPSYLKIELLHYAEYLITKSSTLPQVEDVTVLETNTEERENWQSFSLNNLNQCYAEDEPEYARNQLKNITLIMKEGNIILTPIPQANG
ncbi:DUF2281 domain-containing protein [Nostoc sp. WHI]|uniref:DUF2281 domain-containing protein n=1 Tax=Nostoc sp. WHI TaxID=2650611 RepID=UPI0018C5B739|nr:DUF2281 domain-containing protein [Nostoc sp. WHI]MBG1266148.1 DUF2281 domain-containing protein [Nostoc sp. WHI]